MITSDGMRALRVSATMAHAVPALRVRLRDEAGTRVEVAAEPSGLVVADGPGAVRLTPCQYRTAVGRVWELHGDGQPVRLLDLQSDPAVDIGVPPGGATLGSGVHRVPFGGRHLYVSATTLDLAAIHEAVAGDGPDDGLEALAEIWGIGLRVDCATDVTVVWAELDAGDRSLQHALLEVLERVVVRLAVAELIAGTSDAASSHER